MIYKEQKGAYFYALIFYIIIYLIFFFPVIGNDKIFLVGTDHLLQNLPNFFAPKNLWTNYLQGGFPVFADPQIATWYPLSNPLKYLISNPTIAWDLYVISAYILASFFCYGYTFTLTKSKIAASCGGLIFGMSGFMVSHIEHTNLIHSIAWLPLSLWAVEKLRQKISKIWFFLGVISITFNILAGHPQITVYSLILIILYVLTLGQKAKIKPLKSYQIITLVLGLGISLASLQIIPTLELSKLSVRNEVNFRFYTEYTLPPYEIVKIIFPYFFGGGLSELYKFPYFGSWTLTETSGYIGISSLILAVMGFITHRRQRIAQFWLIVAIVSLLLALGKSTPLAWLSYQVPIHNKFRCLARHFGEMSLAISVLASLGIKSLLSQKVSQKLLSQIFIGCISVFWLAFFYIKTNSRIKSIINADYNLNSEQIFAIFANPALKIPLIILILSILTLQSIFWLNQRTNFRYWNLILIPLLIFDLSSFGYFYNWQQESGNYQFTQAESHPFVSKYKQLLQDNNQRIISLNGVLGGMANIRPNLSRQWQIASASIYNPLMLKRYADFLSSDYASGIKNITWALTENQSFNLMAIRYLFKSLEKSSDIISHQNILWRQDEMNLNLGRDCIVQHEKKNKVSYSLSQPLTINSIAIVNHLSCAANVTDKTDVLQITLTDLEGNKVSKTLKAGKDTAEYAYNSLKNQVKHSPVEKIFTTLPDGNFYYSSLITLDELKNIKQVDLEYLANQGSIKIKKITFVNQETQQFYPFNALEALLANQVRWQHLEDINETSIYENKNALPRIWVVPKTITLKPEEIISAIKTSILPDNTVYQPDKFALIEENLDFSVTNFDSEAQVRIIEEKPSRLQIEINSQSPSFMILSDTYYPGWQAKIDGKKTKLFVTNYIARGIVVPSGNHEIILEFKPFSFDLGLGLTLASWAFLAYFIFVFLG